VWALKSAMKYLKFEDLEKQTKPFISSQLENGSVIYFDNVKPFELFIIKDVKFFKATLDDGIITLELIREMKTKEISLFKNQPLYFIERSKEWSIYKYNENYSYIEGEQFDISEIDLLSKYERHYNRGILYLFRETSSAKVERVNEKIVRIEGLLLDITFQSYHIPSDSDSIYLLNSGENVLLILNTIDLTVSQHCYE
ncbi:hypothetical protein PENTCL1PPCAC_8413, partial [Pristionchus entomophagus]